MKLTITSLIFFLSFTAKSQLVYLTYGYNGAVTNLSGINSVVDNYNDTRPWLQSELGYFNYLDGINMTFGLGFSNFVMEFGYDFRSQKQSVSGTDLYGLYNTRQIKVKNGVGRFATGLMINDDYDAYIIGARMEIGNVKVKTRVFGDSGDKDRFDDIGTRYSAPRLGPSFKYMRQLNDNGLFFSAEFYYLWAFSATDQNVYEVDEDLNNTEYVGEYPEKFSLKPNVFGIHLALGMAGGSY